jgi:hypothetical protein
VALDVPEPERAKPRRKRGANIAQRSTAGASLARFGSVDHFACPRRGAHRISTRPITSWPRCRAHLWLPVLTAAVGTPQARSLDMRRRWLRRAARR